MENKRSMYFFSPYTILPKWSKYYQNLAFFGRISTTCKIFIFTCLSTILPNKGKYCQKSTDNGRISPSSKKYFYPYTNVKIWSKYVLFFHYFVRIPTTAIIFYYFLIFTPTYMSGYSENMQHFQPYYCIFSLPLSYLMIP